MSRWWDRYGFRTVLIVIALIITLWIKQTQATFLSEAYYLIVSPFQSQKQLTIEERLINARILELEQRAAELEQQNLQLKQLLDYTKTQTVETLAAPIIGRNRDRWWDSITLGKGSEDEVLPGYTVMGIGGLVGRVTHVTAHTSKVLLISDRTSRVGAVLTRTRQLGYLEGQGSSTAQMNFFNQVTDIKPGDEISTSNLSKLYPAGFPIGRVKSTEQDVIEVELAAPIDILEWVAVQSFEEVGSRE